MKLRLSTLVWLAASTVSCNKPTEQATPRLRVRVAAAPAAGQEGASDRLVVPGAKGTFLSALDAGPRVICETSR